MKSHSNFFFQDIYYIFYIFYESNICWFGIVFWNDLVWMQTQKRLDHIVIKGRVYFIWNGKYLSDPVSVDLISAKSVGIQYFPTCKRL